MFLRPALPTTAGIVRPTPVVAGAQQSAVAAFAPTLQPSVYVPAATTTTALVHPPPAAPAAAAAAFQPPVPAPRRSFMMPETRGRERTRTVFTAAQRSSSAPGLERAQEEQKREAVAMGGASSPGTPSAAARAANQGMSTTAVARVCPTDRW